MLQRKGNLFWDKTIYHQIMCDDLLCVRFWYTCVKVLSSQVLFLIFTVLHSLFRDSAIIFEKTTGATNAWFCGNLCKCCMRHRQFSWPFQTLFHIGSQKVLHCHRPLKQFQRCQHYHHFPWFRHRSQLTNISLSLRKWCRTCTKEGHLKNKKNMFSIISGRKITFRVLLFLSHSWIKYSVQYSKTKLREAPY